MGSSKARNRLDEPILFCSASPLLEALMASNPTFTKIPVISSQTSTGEGVAVPAVWRAKQFVLIGLVALVALYYATLGYHSPAGESGRADNLSPFDFVGFVLVSALIWLTTPAAWTVAATTFQEAIRRRWVSVLLGFAVVMLGVSTLFTFMQEGEQQKFMRDYGIGFTVILTLITAIFLGTSLIPPEIERRTIFTILSKPVTRLEFLIGKYLGVLLTLALNLAVMSAIFIISYSVFVVGKEGSLSHALLADNSGISRRGLVFDDWNLAKAMLLHFGTLSIMAALAIVLSQLTTGITAIILCFVVYFLGQSAPYWERLSSGSGAASAAATPALGPVLRGIVSFVYFFLPRLDRFDARERLINDLPVAANYLLKAASSGAVYAAVLLTIAYFAFSDREF